MMLDNIQLILMRICNPIAPHWTIYAGIPIDHLL